MDWKKMAAGAVGGPLGMLAGEALGAFKKGGKMKYKYKKGGSVKRDMFKEQYD
tara:strand:+ start:520 stop:678 length:159 start_codon:yes stop_codon:yes gene_type:complete